MRAIFCLMIAIPDSGLAQAPTSRWADEMLVAHNAVRAQVRVAPLVWSSRLAMIAQTWATHLAVTRQFVHRPKSPYGENLFQINGISATSGRVVQAWATEASLYDYRLNRCRGVCGHYTQIVWRGTKEVGCAVARGKQQEVWVCEYDPPGNWAGERPY